MVRLVGLAVLLLLAQDPPKHATFEITADAWPLKPRTAGQKFGMNARDNIPTPEIDEERKEEDDDLARISSKQIRWRIVSVKLTNVTSSVLIGKLGSPQFRGQRKDIKLAAGDSCRHFFVVEDRKGLDKIAFELRDKGSNILQTADAALPPKAKMGTRYEASIIAYELHQEQLTRANFQRAPAAVDVLDHTGKPLKDALLTLVHTKLGMTVEGKTDAAGKWSGSLLVGDWQVFARALVWPEPVPTGGTQTSENPRAFYLAGTIVKGVAKLSPDLAAQLTPDVPVERFIVVPNELADALRYESVYSRISRSYVLSIDTSQARGMPVWLHANKSMPLDIAGWASPVGKRGTYLHVAHVSPKDEVKLTYGKAKSGILSIAPGIAETVDVTLAFPDAPRESYSIRVAGPTEVEVPTGPVRVAIRANLKGGVVLHYAPHVVMAQPGKPADMTPGNFIATPYFQELRGLMLWIAFEDAQGRVLTRIDKPKGEIVGSAGGKELFKNDLKSLSFHFTTTWPNVQPADITYAIALDIGAQKIQSNGKARPRKVFPDPPGSIEVCENLETRARMMLPMIKKSLAGALKAFGFPKFDLTVKFDIRLPPEVGGTGGGGVITLDMQEILEYAHETDRLPYAYTHELGHCLGFGHDPYMTMGPAGVDEGLYGTRGYIALNGTSPTRALDYLDNGEKGAEWSPSNEAWAFFRMWFGPEAHVRMFSERTKGQAKLDKSGFSMAEQICTYYSVAAGQNLAWAMRAFGWPMFDYRIEQAITVLRGGSVAVEKLPPQVNGSYLTTWWVRGPFSMGGKDEPPPWKIHTWDGRFLMLAGESTLLKDEAWQFHLTVQSAGEQQVLLAVGADVQVSFYVNGKRVSRVAAAPQWSQPMHDGYTMERGNATVIPVVFKAGANIMEMVVVRPAGAKGLFVELADAKGKPLESMGASVGDGPEDLTPKDVEKVTHPQMLPVLNPSFEDGTGTPDAWIKGAKDGDGDMVVSLDGDVVAPKSGKKSLKLSARGAVSCAVQQRIVLEEQATYQFTGWIKTEGLRAKVDQAFVHLFTGSPTEKSDPCTEIFDTDVSQWKQIKFKYTATRRTIYIGCVLKATTGARVWLDGFSFVRVK